MVKELYQKQKQHVWTPPMEKLKSQLEKQLGKFKFGLMEHGKKISINTAFDRC